MDNNIKKEFEEKIQYLENKIKSLEIEASRDYQKYLNNEIKYKDKIENLESEINSLLNRLSEIKNEADFQHENYFYNIPAFSKIKQIAEDAIYYAKL